MRIYYPGRSTLLGLVWTIFCILAIQTIGNAQVTANFLYTTPGDSCESRTVQFDASPSSGAISSYTWQFVNKATGATIGSGTGKNILKNFLSPGTYTVTLTVASSSGATNSKSIDIKVYKTPTVNFSVDIKEGCPPLTVTFNDLSIPGDGTIVKWEWNYNDGTKDIFTSKVSPTHSYLTSNEYSPTLIVTNSFGCTKSYSINKLIKVYNKVKPSFLVRDNYSCTAPKTVSLENTSPLNGPFNYEWDFGDGTKEINNNAFVNHTYTTPGVYTVKLIASNLPGTCTDSKTSSGSQNVYIGRPQAGFNLPAEVCLGTYLHLNSNPDPTKLANNGVWLFEDNNAKAYGTSAGHTFNKAGKWKVKYMAFNTYSGCSSDTIVHEIDVLPSPVADFSIDKPKGCQIPHTVTFTNSSTGASRYEWNFGDGSTVLSTTSPAPVSKNYNSFGNFTVSLTAFNSAGCSNKKTFWYINNSKPSVDFDFTPAEGCKPLKVKIKAKVSANDPIAQYIYKFSDGTTDVSTSAEHSHTFVNDGTHTIQVSIVTAQGCTANSEIKNLTVSDVCFTDGGGGGGSGGGGGAIEALRDVDCAKKYTFTFFDTTSTATVLSWDFDGTTITTNQNPVTYTFPDNLGKKKFIVTALLKENPPSTAILEHKIGVVVVDEKANYTIDKSDICKGLDVTFTPIGIDSSMIKKYTWDFGDSTKRLVIDNEAYFKQNLKFLNGSTKHVYADTGSFHSKLIIEDILGCKDSISIPTAITVKGPQAKLTLDKVSFCTKNFSVKMKDESNQNGTVPIVKRTWDFGDGSPLVVTANDTTIEHAYTNNSSYKEFTVKLSVLDALGCEDIYTEKIYSYAPKAQFWTYDTLRCNKFDIFFYNSSSAMVSNSNQYTWSYGDGQTSYGYHGSHIFTDTGVYTITLKVIDNGGCEDSVTKTGYVKLVKPQALFDIGSDTSKCVGTFSLPFVSRSTYSKSYTWDFGDGENSTTDNIEVSHFYKKAGVYDVSLTVTGLDGCTDKTTQKVRIKGPDGTLKIKNNYLCLGEPLSIEVDGYNIKNYYWDFNDLSPTESLITSDSVGHYYKTPGKYVPNVILLSPEGCQITLSATDTVYVDQLDAGPTANIECGDQYTTIKASTALNLPNKYYWTGPAGATILPDSNSLEVQVDMPGHYVIHARGGCEQTDTALVTTSGIVPTADAGPNKKIDCIERTTQLEGNTTTADTHFSWSGPAGATFIPDNTVANPVVDLAGTYVLTVRQKDCETTDVVEILPCSLTPVDTAITLCANLPEAPARFSPYDLNQLNTLVTGTTPAQVFWYQDKQLTIPVVEPVTKVVQHEDVYYAKIQSFDGTETARAQVNVTVYPYVNAQIIFDRDTICETDGPLKLKATKWYGNTLSYNWYKGSRNGEWVSSETNLQLKEPEQSGLYYLHVTSPDCPASWDSINIKIYEAPKLSFPASSISGTYQNGNSIQLPLNINIRDKSQLSSIIWEPDFYLRELDDNGADFQLIQPRSIVQQPFHLLQEGDMAIYYTVTVRTGDAANGCESSASILVNNYLPAKIPNAFTPNNDGLNDTWIIRGIAKYPKTQVKVFDRWGKLVFEDQKGYLTPWDGTSARGEKLPFGTYYYVVNFGGSEDSSDYQQEGWVIIMK